MNKVLVVGCGWIGNEIANTLNFDLYKGKIKSYADAENAVKGYDYVINAAGFNSVDGCEIDKQLAIESNIMVQVYLKATGVKTMLISTGCLIDGELIPQHIDPNLCPTFYGKTKAIAERFADWVFRIRMPFSKKTHRRELLTKILLMDRLHLEPQSITCLDEFIEFIKIFIKNPSTAGIYHCVNSEYISMADIGLQLKKQFRICKFEEIQTKVRRVNVRMHAPILKNVKYVLRETIKERYGTI